KTLVFISTPSEARTDPTLRVARRATSRHARPRRQWGNSEVSRVRCAPHRTKSRAGRRAPPANQESTRAIRFELPVEERPRSVLPASAARNSPFRPFDDAGRNLVTQNHSEQDPIVSE